jgi:hypothetical protein
LALSVVEDHHVALCDQGSLTVGVTGVLDSIRTSGIRESEL